MENYNNIFEEVDCKIRAMMTSKRYRHVIGVVETSSELAVIQKGSLFDVHFILLYTSGFRLLIILAVLQ